MPDLFTPFDLGDLTLPNRIVMAPMTRNRAPDNVPTELMAEYYRQRATAGLIISEGAAISPQAIGYPGVPGIYSEAQVAGWQRVTDAVHEAGGRMFIQLWHVGRISHPDLQPDGVPPVAPSAIRPAGEVVTFEGPKPFVTPRALDLAEIPQIIDQYRQAAVNAKQAGFDGVEIHAANGYLLDQFLRDGTNRRTDAYGGSVENRFRLLGEVVKAVKHVWPEHRIGVRLSPENRFNDITDSNPQATFEEIVTRLSAITSGYLHVLEGDMTGQSEPAVDYTRLRAAYHGPYMANNGYDFERATEAIASGYADLVSFGRPFIANPDLVERFRRGAPLNEPDEATFYGGGAEGYTDYPFLATGSG